MVSDETTQLYCNVGHAINTFVLQGSRAEYGKQIVATVSRQLAEEYGSGFEEKIRKFRIYAESVKSMVYSVKYRVVVGIVLLFLCKKAKEGAK